MTSCAPTRRPRRLLVWYSNGHARQDDYTDKGIRPGPEARQGGRTPAKRAKRLASPYGEGQRRHRVRKGPWLCVDPHGSRLPPSGSHQGLRRVAALRQPDHRGRAGGPHLCGSRYVEYDERDHGRTEVHSRHARVHAARVQFFPGVDLSRASGPSRVSGRRICRDCQQGGRGLHTFRTSVRQCVRDALPADPRADPQHLRGPLRGFRNQGLRPPLLCGRAPGAGQARFVHRNTQSEHTDSPRGNCTQECRRHHSRGPRRHARYRPAGPAATCRSTIRPH